MDEYEARASGKGFGANLFRSSVFREMYLDVVERARNSGGLVLRGDINFLRRYLDTLSEEEAKHTLGLNLQLRGSIKNINQQIYNELPEAYQTMIEENAILPNRNAQPPAPSFSSSPSSSSVTTPFFSPTYSSFSSSESLGPIVYDLIIVTMSMAVESLKNLLHNNNQVPPTLGTLVSAFHGEDLKKYILTSRTPLYLQASDGHRQQIAPWNDWIASQQLYLPSRKSNDGTFEFSIFSPEKEWESKKDRLLDAYREKRHLINQLKQQEEKIRQVSETLQAEFPTRRLPRYEDYF